MAKKEKKSLDQLVSEAEERIRKGTQKRIRRENWNKYTDAIRKLSDKAAEEFYAYAKAGHTEQEIIDFAYALINKYSEASAELACEMYEALAEISKVTVPPAEPADPATYDEVARTVKGALSESADAQNAASAAGRLVKRANADTMLKNAVRDGAQWAWVPQGDTCAFCLTLASRGWQSGDPYGDSGNHAPHIHNNCDCNYMVRHSPDVEIEGYDPDALLEQYMNAEGETSKDKINALRRQHYAANKDYINAQKRAAYARRNAAEKARLKSEYTNIVKEKALEAERFVKKFDKITKNKDVNKTVYKESVEMLKRNNGTNHEDLVLIDANSGKVIHRLTGSRGVNGVSYDDNTRSIIKKAHEEGQRIISLHNHPNGLPPTLDDGSSALAHGYDYGVAVGHNLEVYIFTPADNVYTTAECGAIHEAISESTAFSIEFEDSIWYNALKEFGMKIRRIK